MRYHNGTGLSLIYTHATPKFNVHRVRNQTTITGTLSDLIQGRSLLIRVKEQCIDSVTLVKEWNTEELENYASLVARGNLDFIEVKVSQFHCVGAMY